jgi:hypothetical protein
MVRSAGSLVRKFLAQGKDNSPTRLSAQCIPKRSASERGVYAASLSLLSEFASNSNLVGSFTLKRPDRRRAEAALWRAAKAEGRAPTNRQLLDARLSALLL